MIYWYETLLINLEEMKVSYFSQRLFTHKWIEPIQQELELCSPIPNSITAPDIRRLSLKSGMVKLRGPIFQRDMLVKHLWLLLYQSEFWEFDSYDDFSLISNVYGSFSCPEFSQYQRVSSKRFAIIFHDPYWFYVEIHCYIYDRLTFFTKDTLHISKFKWSFQGSRLNAIYFNNDYHDV